MQTLLNIYKPMYATPLQVIDALRITFPEYKEAKIGYAGRLDPLAHGVLLLMVGEEAKQREKYQDLPKTYEFEALLGLQTDTYDLLGLLQNKFEYRNPKSETNSNTKNSKNQNVLNLENSDFDIVSNFDIRISDFINSKIGTHTQPYPPFSSKAVNGKPLHWWAKQNRLNEITIPTREITIYSFELLSIGAISAEDLKKKITIDVSSVQGHFRQKEILDRWRSYFSKENPPSPLSQGGEQISDTSLIKGRTNGRPPAHEVSTGVGVSAAGGFKTARFRVSCSSGTYVRGLVHELGKFIGTGAVTTEIFRTHVGGYTVKDSLTLTSEATVI